HRGWYFRPQPLRKQTRERGLRSLAQRQDFGLSRRAPTGVASPKGQTGENASTFSSGAYQNANQTVAIQSKPPPRNNTGKETTLEFAERTRRSNKTTPRSDSHWLRLHDRNWL